MHFYSFSRLINTTNSGITMLALLALLALPLSMGMGTSARPSAMHHHHAQPTSERTTPDTTCEHFHISCACLMRMPTLVQVLGVIVLLEGRILAQGIPQDQPE